MKNEVYLYSNYYLQEGTNTIFNDILKELGVNNDVRINHKLSKTELINIFLSQVKIANDNFRRFNEQVDIA